MAAAPHAPAPEAPSHLPPPDPDDLFVSPVKGRAVSRFGTATRTIGPAAPAKPAGKPGTLAWFKGSAPSRPSISGTTNHIIGAKRHPTGRHFVWDEAAIVFIPGAEVRRFRREYNRAIHVDKDLVQRTRAEYLDALTGSPKPPKAETALEKAEQDVAKADDELEGAREDAPTGEAPPA